MKKTPHPTKTINLINQFFNLIYIKNKNKKN